MPGPPLPKLTSTSTSTSTSLSITNPLVLYRTLLATNRLKPDPAQHRLALQLQKLYFRLKDYRPEVEYRRRLERVSRGLSSTSTSTSSSSSRSENGAKQRPQHSSAAPFTTSSGIDGDSKPNSSSSSTSLRPKSSLLSSLLSPKATAEMKALLPSTPLHDRALAIDSPQGMLLYGEVGRGKSMLLDLLFNALPSDRKRRWHFSTFMLDVFRRLEMERIARSRAGGGGGGGGIEMEHEHVVLSLARDTVETSPVLFLDEFQMPDRASSRLVNGFLTGFFGLGGVLVASSNRMPEELSKGVGVRFVDSHLPGAKGDGKWGRGGWIGGMFSAAAASAAGRNYKNKRDETERFVDVLKARCEVWEMEGAKDWRREIDEEEVDAENDGLSAAELQTTAAAATAAAGVEDVALDLDTSPPVRITGTTETTGVSTSAEPTPPAAPPSADSPPHYHLSSLELPSLQAEIAHFNPTGVWKPFSLTIYGRTLTLPQTYFPPSTASSNGNHSNDSNDSNDSGTLLTSFDPLLTQPHGPADYVSLASHFHSVILTDVPVLTSATKNEARRLIWFIDALYEAGCRLVVGAEAPVDGLFFPEVGKRHRRVMMMMEGKEEGSPERGKSRGYESDAIESEAMGEMYQDAVAPFRANVSSYGDGGGGGGGGGEEEWRSADPTFAPYNSQGSSSGGWGQRERVRNVLADEDADFGPTYGNGRGHGASLSQQGLQDVLRRQGMDNHGATTTTMTKMNTMTGLGTVGMRPDFTDTRVLVGEDERFAYKRARSRLWEMCGRRWWRVRDGRPVEEWWRPEGGTAMGGQRARFWESTITPATPSVGHGRSVGVGSRGDRDAEETEIFQRVVREIQMEEEEKRKENEMDREKYRQGSHDGGRRRIDALREAEQTGGVSNHGDGLFRHGASPYRTSEEAPPKFGWQHAWGMMAWGKKAGEWGKGVEGDRRKEREEKERMGGGGGSVGGEDGGVR